MTTENFGVLEGDAAGAKAGVSAAGLNPETILKDGLIAAMGEVGRLFEMNEYFVPEMLVAARAMQGGLSLLKPHLAAGGRKAQEAFVLEVDVIEPVLVQLVRQLRQQVRRLAVEN